MKRVIMVSTYSSQIMVSHTARSILLVLKLIGFLLYQNLRTKTNLHFLSGTLIKTFKKKRIEWERERKKKHINWDFKDISLIFWRKHENLDGDQYMMTIDADSALIYLTNYQSESS